MSADDDRHAVTRIASIVLRSADPDRLVGFYRDAFDFVEDAACVEDEARHLFLGTTHLSIERAGPDAAAYPVDVPGWSPLFQHFALRVADMEAAMARLVATPGWRPISTHGPVTLPARNGGVTAFKFRDPEGHPLEFLALPGRHGGPLFAGIDHTAISVADVVRGIAFYEGLGLVVAGRTLNTGIEQARLDGIDGAMVDVVGLETASGAPPHLELLGYRGAFDRGRCVPAAMADVAATRVIFDVEVDVHKSTAVNSKRDPDGHWMTFRAPQPMESI